MSDSLWPLGLWPTGLLCPWDSPGKNTGVDCHALLQGIFPTPGSNLGLPHCRQILHHLSYQGSLWGILQWPQHWRPMTPAGHPHLDSLWDSFSAACLPVLGLRVLHLCTRYCVMITIHLFQYLSTLSTLHYEFGQHHSLRLPCWEGLL